MPNRTLLATVKSMVLRNPCRFSLRVVLVFLGVLPMAHGDAYLEAIEQAAIRAGQQQAGKPEEPGSGSEDPQAMFEQYLKQRYQGSYLFYKRLPARSQKEVFHEFENGASIDDVRKTIMERFGHSR